jgi:uncharacterized metal-binding protein YceD (DUF177 family)
LKIRADQLHAEKIVSISEKDEWLSDLSFEDRQLSGTLSIRPIESRGSTRVSGDIEAQLALPCCRCGEAVAWTAKLPIDIEVKPHPQEHEKLKVLVREELDEYFVNKQGEIDLFEIVNDAIHLATEDYVYCAHGCSTTTESRESTPSYRPFAALAQLKIDEQET